MPGDQWHPAIRGEQSDRWINVLAVKSLDDAGSLGTMGLTKGFSTEFVEARVFGSGKDATFIRTAGVNRGTTGEAMVVRHLEPKD